MLFDPIEVTAENQFISKILIAPFMSNPYIIGKLKTGEFVASSNTERLKDYYIIDQKLYEESLHSPLTNNVINLT